MALEALKRYAIEQQQATQAEIDNLLKNDAQKRPTSDEKGKSNIKPLVSKENVAEGLLERLAAAYKKQQENVKKSERLRAEVNKSIQAGEDVTIDQAVFAELNEGSYTVTVEFTRGNAVTTTITVTDTTP